MSTPADAKQKANSPICHQVFFIYKKNVSDIWNSRGFRAQQSRREVGVAQGSSGVGAIVGKLLSLQSECVGEVGVQSVGSPIKLTHHIFSRGQWRRARFREHPHCYAAPVSRSKSIRCVWSCGTDPAQFQGRFDGRFREQSSLLSLSECLKAGSEGIFCYQCQLR